MAVAIPSMIIMSNSQRFQQVKTTNKLHMQSKKNKNGQKGKQKPTISRNQKKEKLTIF